MNEIKKIHLGRQQFTIATEAYKLLHEYLEAIEKQPGVQAEVAKEVEARMAELLTERGITSDKVVLLEDVEFLKEQLGEPHDFKDDQEEGAAPADKQAEPEVPKRLYRDTDTGLIAGVASGLATYMGIDAVIVRLVFVLLSFASGAGIILYILLWLIVPEAKTTSERLQMRGKAVTVDSLKKVIDRADIAGASERASRSFGRGLSQVINWIFRAILTVIGAGFVIAGSAIMLWAVATGVYMLIHGGQVGTTVVFPLGSREVWTVVLAFITAVILGLFFLIIGLTMITRKWRLPSWVTVALLGVFFVAGGVGTALAFDTVPHIRDRFRAAHHTQNITVDPFTSVKLRGDNTAFTFKPDTKTYVELSYLGDVETKTLAATVENSVLTVDTSTFVKTPGWCSGICFYSDHDMKVTIHAPSMSEVSLDGNDSSFRVSDQMTQQSITIQAENRGISEISLDHISAQNVTVTNSQNQARRTIAIAGIKSIATEEQGVRMDEYMTSVSGADHVALNTTDMCDQSEPLIYLQGIPADVTINGQAKTWEQFQTLRTPDGNNSYNCVTSR